MAFLGIVPLSVHVADGMFFTGPYRPGFEHPVLLVWPTGVEIKWFKELREISPRPPSAAYSFSVPSDRQKRIESEVRALPAPNGGDAGWKVSITQISAGKQRIQLDLMGDGITGLVYEATPDGIVPLKTRRSGVAGALNILFVIDHRLDAAGASAALRGQSPPPRFHGC